MNPCFFPRDSFHSTNVFSSSNPFPWMQLDLYTNEFKICISIPISLQSFGLEKWIVFQRSVIRYPQTLKLQHVQNGFPIYNHSSHPRPQTPAISSLSLALFPALVNITAIPARNLGISCDPDFPSLYGHLLHFD